MVVLIPRVEELSEGILSDHPTEVTTVIRVDTLCSRIVEETFYPFTMALLGARIESLALEERFSWSSLAFVLYFHIRLPVILTP